MEALKQLVFIVLLSLFLSLFISCGNEDTESENEIEDHIASGKCDEDGCIVEVSDPNSPLYGAKVEIPEGALEDEIIVTIDVGETNVSFPNDTESLSLPVLFGPSEIEFKLPVFITIPFSSSFDDNSPYGVFYENQSDKVWEICTLIDQNTNPETLTAVTSHFSEFQILVLLDSMVISKDSGFHNDVDGFLYGNTSEPGDCHGMSSYANWYFDKKKFDCGNLFDQFDADTGALIADEAQNVTWLDSSKALSLYMKFAENFTKDKQHWITFNQLRLSLNLYNNPQILGLFNGNDSDVQHAVLVTSYNKEESSFNTYNPNYPGTTWNNACKLVYDSTTHRLTYSENCNPSNYKDFVSFSKLSLWDKVRFGQIYDKYEEYCEDPGVEIILDDFEQYSTGGEPKGNWTISTWGDTYFSVEVYSDGQKGKSLQLFGGITESDVGDAILSWDTSTEEIRIDFSVNVISVDQIFRVGFFANDDGSSGGNEVFINFEESAAGTFDIASGSFGYILCGNYALEEWHKLQLKINTNSKKASLKINSETTPCNDFDLILGEDKPIESLCIVDHLVAGDGGYAYFDDFRVSDIQ